MHTLHEGLQNWLPLFLGQLRQTSLLEWIAVIFGVIQVLLAKSNKVTLYPAGIIATLATAWVLFQSRLFAESALNIYYLVMSIYGWYYWSSHKGRPQPPITRARRGEWLITGLIALGGWGLLYLILKHYTNSDVPVWDSIVSSSAWAGMWLLAKRKLENWILLNISNLLAVPLLIHKELPLFAALTVFLFIVAVFGYFQWKRILKDRTLKDA